MHLPLSLGWLWWGSRGSLLLLRALLVGSSSLHGLHMGFQMSELGDHYSVWEQRERERAVEEGVPCEAGGEG